ncbi:hypothetical protein CTheo_2345 [Ceratobasidium theobromae]|uniref:Uncharacterized protein n=1 Tax=Ceratobasidium theobromae TaxID=1582974 RepID=A0A5N5QRD2_9AGAM|nr:hypothetical protein CTheo_2345 [Ceratobasidium theobromae]
MVLGSYVLIAIMGLAFHKSRKPVLESGPVIREPKLLAKASEHPRQANDSNLVSISGVLLADADEITERTLKEYGYITDSDSDLDLDSGMPLPDCEPPSRKPILRNTVRNDIGVLFRGPISGCLDSNLDMLSHKTRTISQAGSVRYAMANCIDVPPMPPQMPSVKSDPIQIRNPTSRARLVVNSSSMPDAHALLVRHRPPPIIVTADSHGGPYISPTPYRCFSSSPLKYSSVPSPESSPRSPSPRTPTSRSSTMSNYSLKQSMWAPKK